MACQMEHGYAVGQSGLKVFEVGPWEVAPNDWQLSYLPALTKLCDLCAERTAKGKQPTCVKHCQSQCMAYGTLEELGRKLAEKPKQVLYSVQ
jgi:anaerobic dimethyl sulfoxide reductase subunit B (iron-sulfur subunit)